MLIIQLDPPAPYTVSLRAVPSHEVLTVVRDVVGVLLQATLDTLGIEGGMEAVRGVVVVLFFTRLTRINDRIPISYKISSISSKKYVPLPFVMDEVIYANAGVLSFRHGVLSPPAAVFRCSRPMRNIRPRLTRALLPRSSIHFPRTFSSHPICFKHPRSKPRIADSTYKRHAGERRLCRREATTARHARTRYHARAARRLCGRSAKIGRPEPRRALFGSGRQDAS